MACAAARVLQECGVGQGWIVATCVDEGHLMIVIQLAVLLAGSSWENILLLVCRRCHIQA